MGILLGSHGTSPEVRSAIRLIRKQRVILDADLARFYGVTTKRLNEAVKRNHSRFPEDFAFQLSEREYAALRATAYDEPSQATDAPPACDHPLRSQIATSKEKRGGRRYRPYAFTEHGAIMAATILKSRRAIEMSVFVVRAFVRIREQLAASTALAKRLAEIEKALLTHDQALIDLYEQIRPLLLPPPEPPRKPIGFSVRENRARYRTARRSHTESTSLP
ncbi:MAG: ORF6N domain-containing protein [Lentisphaerae bacterium]|nr:ORF6N domain-containing protein [Lentisphaerota bacterium]